VTDAAFQGRVLGELGRLSEDMGALRTDVSELRTSVARIEERGEARSRRIGQLEQWRDGREDAAEATGRHQVRALQKQLAEQIKEHRAEVVERKRQVAVVAVKAGLLALGAILAIIMPALARAIGVHP